MSDAPLVVVDQPIAGCAVVTLDRPRARNAMSLALRRELVIAFDRLRADPAIRVVVLTGAGDAFCAGLDLKELGAARDPSAALVSAEDIDPVLAMARFDRPIIGAINGPAITGGFELALACDLLVASTRARFADTHARVGVLPGWGLSQKLPRIIGVQRAKDLAFTGNFLDAERAEAWGLVNRVVAPEALLPEALALAGDMLQADPAMLVAYKRLIDEGMAMNLADALRHEKACSRASATAIAAATIDGRRREIAERGRAQNTDPQRSPE